MLGLIMSLQGFSQTDTNNTKLFPDTTISDPYEVVCTPKYIMVQIVKDLKDYDLTKEELDARIEQNDLQNQFMQTQDSIIVNLKNHCTNIGKMLEERSEISDTYKLQLDKVARQNEKKKSWIKGLAIALVVSVFSNILTH